MKILIYSANFHPEQTGIGKYSGEMARWLSEHGHEVRVVAAPPYYPSWHVDPAYRWPPYRKEKLMGATVWRAPLWVPKHPGGMTRVLHLLTFALSSAPLMLLQVCWKPDVVFTVAPAIVCAPIGLLTARFCGAKAWLHIQDFEVDVAFDMGLLKGKKPRALVSWMERQLLRSFDCVSSISQRMLDRLSAKGVSPKRIRYFKNWADVSQIKPWSGANRYRSEMGIASDTTVVLFSGSLGNKQGLLVIPEAAKLLAHRSDVVFVVCGNGVMADTLKDATKEMPNVKMLPLQPIEQLNELLGLADIQLLTQHPGAADLVLPSKLTGMLASGRPVIATCNSGTEIAGIVSRCGKVVDPENSQALATAIGELADAPETRKAMGVFARQYAESHLALDAVMSQWVAHAMGSSASSSGIQPSAGDEHKV